MFPLFVNLSLNILQERDRGLKPCSAHTEILVYLIDVIYNTIYKSDERKNCHILGTKLFVSSISDMNYTRAVRRKLKENYHHFMKVYRCRSWIAD